MAIFHSTTRILPIKGFPNYEVGEDGSVWSFKVPNTETRRRLEPRKLKPRKASKYGHVSVVMYRGGKRYDKLVHHLVLETFDRPQPKGMECRHLDGNPRNNRLENLRWGTRKENSADRIIHGTTCRGEKSVCSKLTSTQVQGIRRRLKSRERIADIATKFNVSPTTVSRIKNKFRWGWLDDPAT